MQPEDNAIVSQPHISEMSSMHHHDKSSALKNVWIHLCMCVLLI